MKPKTIGIVGGAGPFAGILLLKSIMRFSQTLYGCNRDSDYPKVYLINFPFSDMLSEGVEFSTIQKELNLCLQELRKNGAQILGIACNTLHAFLDDEEKQEDLIQLPQAVALELSQLDISDPLVLCTSTSSRLALHKKFFPCCYPNAIFQKEIDQVIEQILKGEETEILERLTWIINEHPQESVILGCTELSLYFKQLNFLNKRIIDPLEILAQKIVEKSFQNKELSSVCNQTQLNRVFP